MPTTPVYGWEYLGRFTSPLTYPLISGETALLAIEATVAALAARVAAIEPLVTFLEDDWTSFTPTWTGITGTAPTPASHSVSGRWRKIDSNLAVVEGRIVGLTSSGWGGAAGVYGFGLPFAITTTSRDNAAGAGHLLDSGTNEYPCICRPHDVSTLRLHHTEGSAHNVGATTPFTLTTNDTIRWSIIVEPA